MLVLIPNFFYLPCLLDGSELIIGDQAVVELEILWINKLINPAIRFQAVFCVQKIIYLHTREISTSSVGLKILVEEL